MKLIAVILALLINLNGKLVVKTVQFFHFVCVLNVIIMDPGKIFQIITNSTLLATRLLSGSGRTLIEFSQNRYCAVVREDLPISSDVINVVANHKEGATVKYSISEGNTEGLFDIDEFTGVVKLVAPLDFETTDKHEIVVTGEGGGQVVQAVVEVTVTDVNDNRPIFINPDPHVTVIEEDDRHLPTTLLKVEAKDPDQMDQLKLRYSISGDGIDGYLPGDAYFSINSITGDLIQLKALDRDPPHGKRFWRLKVKVEDGQENWNPKTQSYYLGNQLTYQNDQESSWYSLHPSSGFEINSSRKRDRYNILTSSHLTKKRMRDFKEIPASKKMRLFNDDAFDSAAANSFINPRWSVEPSLHKEDMEGKEDKDKVMKNEGRNAEVNIPWKTSGYHADNIFGSHEVHPRKDIKSEKNYLNVGYQLDAPGSQMKTVTEQVFPVSVEKSRKASIVYHRRGRHSKRNGKDNHTVVSNRPVPQSISNERGLEQSLNSSGENRNVTFHSIYESTADTMASSDGQLPEYPKHYSQDSYEDVIFVNKKGNISESRARTEHEDGRSHKYQHLLPSVGVKKNKLRFSWSKKAETDQRNAANEQRMARFLYKNRRSVRDIHFPGEKTFMGGQSQHENISGKSSDFISHKQRVTEHKQISDKVLDSADENRPELHKRNELYECCGDHKNEYVDVKHIYKNIRFNRKIANILQDGNSTGLSPLNSITSKNEPAKTENEPLSSDSITNPTISKGRIFERKTRKKSSLKPTLNGKDISPSKYSSATLERNHPKSPERKNIRTTFDRTEAPAGTESFLPKGSDLGQKYSSLASIKTISSKRLANPLLDKHAQHYDNRKKDADFGVPRFGEREKHLVISPQMNQSYYQFQNFTKVSNSKVIYQLLYSPKYIRSRRFHIAGNVNNHSYPSIDANSNVAYVGKKNKFSLLSPITSVISKPRDVHIENSVMHPQPFPSPEDLSSFSQKDVTIKGDWFREHSYRPPYNNPDLMKPSNITYNTNWKEKQVMLNDVLTFPRVNRDTNRKRTDKRTKSRIPMIENTRQKKIDEDAKKSFRGKRKANDERYRLENSETGEADRHSQQDDTCPDLNASFPQGISENVNQDKSSVHSAEMTVTIVVKDINDNPPAFPNTTMFGEIQENGPAELGRRFFMSSPKSGLITTAICCLDRETTPEYSIQVVAADGGGLKVKIMMKHRHKMGEKIKEKGENRQLKDSGTGIPGEKGTTSLTMAGDLGPPLSPSKTCTNGKEPPTIHTVTTKMHWATSENVHFEGSAELPDSSSSFDVYDTIISSNSSSSSLTSSSLCLVALSLVICLILLPPSLVPSVGSLGTANEALIRGFKRPAHLGAQQEWIEHGILLFFMSSTHMLSTFLAYSNTLSHTVELSFVLPGAVTNLLQMLSCFLEIMHEIVVTGEGGGQVVQAVVEVTVTDVNDNRPIFINPDPHVTVIEEDDRHLPTTLLKPRVNRDTNRKRNQMRTDIRTNSRIPMIENTRQKKIDEDAKKSFRGKRKANDERYRLENSDTGEADGHSQQDDTCPDLNASIPKGISENVNQDKSSVHSAEMTVTIVVKDINDNPPAFPNTTMFGEIQENGPAELSVAQVSAWDKDDATEGTNARITYFIEKNVIHDRTGEAIFYVHPKSGLITTAICCLDRETTPEYSIQVVAADGGGLKGTGTVLVRLRDENDNSPHLARKSWDLEIVETPGEGRPDSSTLLEMTVGDPDSHNDFHFRIVKDSGPGWDRFGIRSSGASGQLYALQKLDYEDEGHRKGFRFMVQVTDKGEEGWEDPRHQDTAWVGVKLKDRNDNPPLFDSPSVHLSVSEDTAPGTILVNMTATDPDKGKGGQVKYQVLGRWDTLRMDELGSVTLYRTLDRESDSEVEKVFRILAMDHGDPPLTSTATLTITVTDVNDCPPRLLPPTVLHVTEGDPPSLLGVLTATDDDIWSLGHGPPFTLALSPSNPRNILNIVELKFFQHLDEGRGGAELWTRGSLDREANRELHVKIFLSDSGHLNNTQIVTIIVGDLNDNPMKPASKTVYLWKAQNTGSEAPLGRVYVDDPDDWDVGDKTFRWAGKPFPLFTLNKDDGTIYASSQVREGRYFLQFSVTDHVWKQVDVSANVTVIVRVLTHDALSHATPIFLTPTTPADLTRGWIPLVGGGKLGKLINAVQGITDLADYGTEVVSVYGTDGTTQDSATFHSVVPFNSLQRGDDLYPMSNRNPRNSAGQHSAIHLNSYACVWLSVTDYQGIFMDPVRLQGLIALHSRELEEATGFVVTFKNPSSHLEEDRRNVQKIPAIPPHPTLGEVDHFSGSSEYLSTSSSKHVNEEGPGRVASMASTLLPLQVVDTNLTSLVTPLLLRSHECASEESSSSSPFKNTCCSCTPASCLNGGSCVRFPTGSRCICPGGSKGPQCKIYSRTFNGNGWAWLKPPSACLPMTISIRLLTQKPDGLLLYNGPLVPPSDAGKTIPTPMLTVQLVNQKPQVLIQGFGEFFTLQVNKSVSDGNWHTVYVRLDRLGISMMVDICGFGTLANLFGDSHCVVRKSWRNHHTIRMWESVGPLQIGGIAQRHPRSLDFGWEDSVTPHRFDGCLSHLAVNGQMLDLGEPSHSEGSLPGCRLQDLACIHVDGACGIHSECTGGLWKPKCQCEPGWSGPNCETPTVPTTLGLRSYIKLALSFTPPSQNIVIQVRVRTLGFKTGMLMHLVTQQTNSSITLHLQSGVACASMSVAGLTARTACVNGHPIGDGEWHTIRAERHGHNLIAMVDDGDDGRLNYSIPSPVTHIQESSQKVTRPPITLQIDKHDGVTIGGLPHLVGASLLSVKEDLTETCIDDLRISDRQLPLPPAVNGSSWGQVTNSNGLLRGCQPPSSCLNVTCKHPLSCHRTWLSSKCSCGPGLQYIDHACADLDECLLKPCLHGGTCVNLRPGYKCLCGPNYLGDNCEWAKITGAAHPLSTPVIVASVTSSLLALVLLGILFSFRHRRLRGGAKREADKQQRPDEESPDKTSITTSKTEGERASRTSRERDTGKKKKKKKKVERDSSDEALRGESQPRDEGAKPRGPEDDSHTTFLELLKLSKSLPRKEIVQGCDEGNVGGIAMNVITTSGGAAQNGVEPLPLPPHHQHPLRHTLLPGEDLHIYAYEGDGSSSGSLTSTISGLQAEVDREESSSGTVLSEFLEVIDLLKNLPDAPNSSSLLSKLKQKEKSEKVSQGEKLLGRQRSSVESTGAKTSSEVPSGPSASSSERGPRGRGLLHISRELKDDLKTTAC
ncbi:LOW QUALITY PROTEIN: neural-cadherin-like [Macrobrachium nipponense]|uniref:LOW QUALITY PROTEIN: neural-cadherin-like n=1 Tax=Macrobrachium nipponense TaxID=159736 RepID=UPI0030C7DD71